MINGKSLVADYDNGAVALEEIKTPGNLQASFMVTKGLFVDPLSKSRTVDNVSYVYIPFFQSLICNTRPKQTLLDVRSIYFPALWKILLRSFIQ